VGCQNFTSNFSNRLYALHSKSVKAIRMIPHDTESSHCASACFADGAFEPRSEGTSVVSKDFDFDCGVSGSEMPVVDR